jgi:hypothetical protein
VAPCSRSFQKVSGDDSIFVYGISDRQVGGLDLQKPDGNVSPIYSSQLTGDVPLPFSKEPTGGSGIRMHHKFAVIDFDQPTAHVYLGSYNFSPPADTQNGENLLLVWDRRIAASYTVEALRIFDHYHFRVLQHAATKGRLSSPSLPGTRARRPGGKRTTPTPTRSAIESFSRRTGPHGPVLLADAAQKVIPFGCNRMNRLCTGLPSPTGERYPSTSCNQFIDLENSQ